jgi:hypothetical protein
VRREENTGENTVDIDRGKAFEKLGHKKLLVVG